LESDIFQLKQKYKSRDVISLKILREGKEVTLKVKLEEKK